MKKIVLRQSLIALCFLPLWAGEAYCKDPGSPNDGSLSIPGIIEVEDFDLGGEGKSYHDEDSVNSGGSYRPDEGVDIDTCDNGGFVVGWTKKGEWMDYTVDVKKTSEYTYSAIVASGLDGSGFSLLIDGKAITPVVEVPNTGAWTLYKRISGNTSSISAGKHTLRIYVEADYCNIDKISFRPKDEEVEYRFTSPSSEMQVGAGKPFTVSWTTNDENVEKYNLNWINDQGDTVLLKEGVGCHGSFSSNIPDDYVGQSGHYTLSQVKVSGGSGLIPSDFDGANHVVSNPIIWADVPDVSVIRVEDTYYMVSTTMHMNPGAPIMASKDLVRWRTINYAHQALDNGRTNELNMENGKNAYGKGSWASNIKYKDGTWYVLTPSYTTNKTHLAWTKDILSGEWESTTLPFYHDPSLLLDDDGRIYVIYGSGNISIVELSSDGKSTKGNPRTLLTKPASIAGSNFYVECEGSQAMKKGDYYYIFLISWPSNSCRSVLCYRSKSLSGNFEGKVLLQDNGVAQGGIFDTPEGNWYGMFFRDNGSVGRIPYLLPVSWVNDWPVLGDNGKVPSTLNAKASQEDGYGLVTSDEFEFDELALEWQWNHNPDSRNWKILDGKLRLTNQRTDKDVVSTKNTLTQRSFGPQCSGWTKLDTKGMKEGDCAGLVALQEYYGFAGVTVKNGAKSIIMSNKGEVKESVPLNQDEVYLRIDMNFQGQKDQATFYYSKDGNTWTKFGNTLQMRYELSHFMGYRYGLFYFGTQSTDGYADFDYFKIGKDINSAVFIDKTDEKNIEETIFAQSAHVTIVEQTGDHSEEADDVRLTIDQKAGQIIISAPDELLGCELVNMNGQIIRTSSNDRISVSGFPIGIYLLRIRFERNILTKIISVR